MKIVHKNGEVIFIDDDGSQRVIPLSNVEFDDAEERSLDFSHEIEPLTMAERRRMLTNFDVKVRNERDAAFDLYLRQGREALSDEQRAQSVGTDSAGGFLTPESFHRVFTTSLKQHDELFDAATLVETDRGSGFVFPLDDDTSAVATLVAENATSVTNAPIAFDIVNFLRCPQWRSGVIVASMELAADSAFPLSTLLAKLFGARFARGVGQQFVTNLIADSDAGVTSASPSAITGDEILDLIASVDPAYSINGGFLMNVTTLTGLRKLKASTGGSYLIDFDKDPTTGRLTMFDYPVYISPSLANLGASAKPIAFGDLSRFIRRQVKNSLVVRQYNEKYATSGQLGYEAFLRVDGRLAKAANAPLPIRFLQCHS